MDIFDEGNRKRHAPGELLDDLDPIKRARLGPDGTLAVNIRIPPLPPGPTSFAQLYTLADDEGLTTFDVQQLPVEMIVQITMPVLQRIDKEIFDETINVCSHHPDIKPDSNCW
jgi:symplekin